MQRTNVFSEHVPLLLYRDVKGGEGIPRGRLWTVIPYKTKTSQKTHMGVLQEQKNHTPESARAFVESQVTHRTRCV